MYEFSKIIVNDYKPHKWVSDTVDEEVRRVELASYDKDFLRLKGDIDVPRLISVERIERIENPFLWGRYLLKKAEYEARGLEINERILFHCTASKSIPAIIKDNLDWRRFIRTRYGKGVCFSPKTEYANRYANHYIGSERAMIVARVLVARSCPGSYSMVIPDSGYDTSTDICDNVIVKYSDDEFYPHFVAYYTL